VGKGSNRGEHCGRTLDWILFRIPRAAIVVDTYTVMIISITILFFMMEKLVKCFRMADTLCVRKKFELYIFSRSLPRPPDRPRTQTVTSILRDLRAQLSESLWKYLN
jgi:hypothetical protein